MQDYDRLSEEFRQLVVLPMRLISARFSTALSSMESMWQMKIEELSERAKYLLSLWPRCFSKTKSLGTGRADQPLDIETIGWENYLVNYRGPSHCQPTGIS